MIIGFTLIYCFILDYFIILKFQLFNFHDLYYIFLVVNLFKIVYYTIHCLYQDFNLTCFLIIIF